MKSIEANLRMIYAMRSNVIGFSGLEKICSVMNLPKPDVKDKKSLKFDDIEKANILQSQFKSVFVKEPGGEIPKTTIKSRSLLNDLNITEEMVKNLLLKLNNNKSLGPDEIHPRLVKELANHLARPIASFFNQTLAEGVLPRDLKKR